MQDYFEQKREKIAVELIKEWKANESKLTSQYGSREEFFFKAMAAALWRDAKIRDEFQGNKENLKSFLENETRAKTHKRDITTHKRPQTLGDDATDDDATRAKWDADPSLQAEFGDYSTFAAYEKNAHRARVYNR